MRKQSKFHSPILKTRAEHGFHLLMLLLGLIAVARAEPEHVFQIIPSPQALDQARLAVRDYLATHEQRGDLVVELAAGTYELPAPVRFEPADSGRNGFSIIYRAARGAEVILSGGRQVTGWEAGDNGVWRATVGPGVDLRQLWVNDQRGTRARTPNAGETFTLVGEKQTDGFDLPRAQLAGVHLRPGEVEVSVLIAWMHKRLRIARLAETDRSDVVRAVIEPGDWDGVTKQPQGDRVYLNRHYWLENAREFLDAPGEFFLDREAGVLFYQPRRNEDLAAARVIRPELESLIVLDGNLAAPVHHLRFEGLSFAYTGWTRPNRFGFVDVQANSLVPADLAAAADPQYRHNQRKDRIPAAFQAYTADNIVVYRCNFRHLGGTGVMFTHGGNDNVIEGNSLGDIAGGGIELGEDAARPANPRLFPRRNRIANNYLLRIGQDYFGSVGILGYYTDSSIVTHNVITTVPYTGISWGWGWGNPPAAEESRNNRITHNRVTDYMMGLDDGGGIYTTDRMPGSEIAYNVIRRMRPPDKHTKAGGAIYPDQFSEGLHIHHNIVTEAIRWLFLWNPNIKGNRVDSNYADTDALRNDAPDNQVEPVHLVTNGNWPDKAHAISKESGLEREFTEPRESGTR